MITRCTNTAGVKLFAGNMIYAIVLLANQILYVPCRAQRNQLQLQRHTVVLVSPRNYQRLLYLLGTLRR
jgi:hypothetical protein